jgi:hypothetical protein
MFGKFRPLISLSEVFHHIRHILMHPARVRGESQRSEGRGHRFLGERGKRNDMR